MFAAVIFEITEGIRDRNYGMNMSLTCDPN